MATESVKEEATVPRDLPELLRRTKRTDVPFACIGRDQYVSWVAALSDLLMLAAPSETANDTPHDAAWLLYELTKTLQAFDECAQKARKAA